MLCYGIVTVTSDFCKKHKKYAYDYAVKWVSSNEHGCGILGVAICDFANVR